MKERDTERAGGSCKEGRGLEMDDAAEGEGQKVEGVGMEGVELSASELSTELEMMSELPLEDILQAPVQAPGDGGVSGNGQGQGRCIVEGERRQGCIQR